MNLATRGWFDAWALPGGFDPSGLVKGWGTARTASCLCATGITAFAISGGGDVVVRGTAPHGGPWRVGIRDPGAVVLVLSLTDAAVATSGSYERGAHVLDPRTGRPVTALASATVVGPDLNTADAYATALYAAGIGGLAWFAPDSEHRAFTVDDRLVATFSPGSQHLPHRQRGQPGRVGTPSSTATPSAAGPTPAVGGWCRQCLGCGEEPLGPAGEQFPE